MAEPTAVQRRSLAKLGYAMPDGSYYIRAGSIGASDLQNAIGAVGRGQDDPHNAIRTHIMKRAKSLGLSSKIPADWQPDGSLKGGDALEHFGITGMRWGSHLPGTEAVGGKGNPDGANGPSPTAGMGGGKPNPFIQRGDHADDKSGSSSDNGHDGPPPEQQASHAIDALQALRDKAVAGVDAAQKEDNAAQAPEQPPSVSSPAVAAAAAAARAPAVKTTAAKATAPVKAAAKPTKNQTSAALTAAKNHAAHLEKLLKAARASAAKHKASAAKLAKHPNKAHAKKSISAAAKLHAAHVKHLQLIAQKAAAAHKAALAKIKTPSTSHLTEKQKAAQLKAAKASALKRHKAALARKSAGAQTRAAAAKRTTAQTTAYNKLRENAQNHTLQLSIDDLADEFLEHHGVKGMKWGVRRAVRDHAPAGDVVRKVSKYAHEHPAKAAGIAYGTLQASRLIRSGYAHREEIAGTAKVVAHIIKVMNQQRKTPEAETALALGRGFIQGHVIHGDDSLEHHGIKGMKWGVRKIRSDGGYNVRVPVGSSDDHKQAVLIKAKVRTSKGIHALSNDELQVLSNRLNLEANYHRLNPHTGKLEKGRKFVKSTTNDAKTILDAVNTGQRVIKTAQDAGFSNPYSGRTRGRRNKNQTYHPQFKLTPAS